MQNCNPFLYISLTMNLVLVNPRMYTQIHTPIVVQGGDGGRGWGAGVGVVVEGTPPRSF